MPLQLTNLDDRSYAELVAEARRLIPIYDPAWTNHNPSDPGITLVELFAYLTEMLLYRLDRVTADNRRKFLKLLNGPGWKPSADLTEDIRTTVLSVRAHERAVTATDFERLAIENFNPWLASMRQTEPEGAVPDEWRRITQLDTADAANLPSGVSPVARAACVVSRDLDRGTEAQRTKFAPGHVSLIVLPEDASVHQPSAVLKQALWGYLDERRTLTTRHHVVGPYYAPIKAEIVIASTTGALSTAVAERVKNQLTQFLDPHAGGTVGGGWPFGRDVYVSELCERIEAVDGVDYVTDLMLSSKCLSTDERCTAATAAWHAEGDLIGMALAPHHLPIARFDVAKIVVAPRTRFLPVRVTATLTPASGAPDAATLKRQAKAVVRKFFHPLYQGPGPATADATDLSLAGLRSTLTGIPGVAAVALMLQADPSRLLTQNGQVVGLQVEAGELVNWHTRITVEQS